MGRRTNGRARAITERQFRACDGTRLTWYEAGTTDGPTLLFLSGLGGGFGVWRPFVERFGARCRLVGWDYRGLYESSAPTSRGALSMDHQIGDLLALIEHAEIESPVLVGWSMGVQLALELHRDHAEVPRALIGIHGTSGRPLDTAFDSPWSARVGPAVLAVLTRLERSFAGVGPRLVDAPGVARGFTWLCRSLGLMAPEIDLDAFREMARDWTRLDFAAYAETFAHLAQHDAADLLAKIETPTLIVAGGRDPLTPPRTAQRMVGAMPDAELALVDEATHFGLLERPAQITDHAARFLRGRLDLDV
jgi:pimeloyl-ACP methyl ester carboxylesterase